MNQELTNILFEAGCIKITAGELFTYASGKKGPIYCDTRKLIGKVGPREIFVSALADKVTTLAPKIEYVGAMATGAISLGAILADRMDLPFFYIRPEAKSHGKKNQIEGLSFEEVQAGQNKCLLFEDLINSGGSLLKGIEALKATPLELSHIVSLVSYDFDVARQRLENYGTLNSLVEFSDILAWVKSKNISGYEKLVSWHETFYNK